MMKKAGIVLGSVSDLPTVRKAIDTPASLQIPYETHAYSAHRTPAEAAIFAREAKKNGFGVIIAAGMTAQMILPVIGIPCKFNTLNGIDALLSTVQMLSGIPVATVAID